MQIFFVACQGYFIMSPTSSNLATTVELEKSGQNLFCSKNSIFKSFQSKNTSITFLEHSQTNSSTQNTQKWSKNSKSSWVRFSLVQIYFFRQHRDSKKTPSSLSSHGTHGYKKNLFCVTKINTNRLFVPELTFVKI